MWNSPARRDWHGASLAPVLLGAALLASPALAAPATPALVVAADGLAKWTSRDGPDRRGHYVRIWRNDKAGWRLLFDELLPAPPLKPPPG